MMLERKTKAPKEWAKETRERIVQDESVRDSRGVRMSAFQTISTAQTGAECRLRSDQPRTLPRERSRDIRGAGMVRSTKLGSSPGG